MLHCKHQQASGYCTRWLDASPAAEGSSHAPFMLTLPSGFLHKLPAAAEAAAALCRCRMTSSASLPVICVLYLAHTPYTALAAFNTEGFLVMAYTQPSPTASYSSLNTSTSRTMVPSGRMAWMRSMACWKVMPVRGEEGGVRGEQANNRIDEQAALWD